MRNTARLRIGLIAFSLLCLGVAYYSVFIGFGEDPIDWTVKKIETVGRCGTQRRLIMENPNQNLPKKTIALVENLTKSERESSCRMWSPYEIVAKVALDRFKEMNPTFAPEFLFLSSITEVNRRAAPAEKIELANNQGASIVVGNAWSTTASIAADQAAVTKIPYIAPTAVTARVHDGEWSVSVGVDVRDAAQGIAHLVQKLGKSKVIVLENTLRIQEREYSDAVKKLVKDHVSFEIQNGYPLDKIALELKKDPNHIVFFPGYSHERQFLKKIASDFPKTVFVVGPQWAHDYIPLTHDFKGMREINIYCVTDFYGVDSPDAVYFQKKWREYQNDYDEGGFRFALYDAVMLALQVLNEEGSKDHASTLAKLKNFGPSKIAVKTPFNVSNGKVSKTLNIVRWDDTRFVKFEEFNPQPSS